MKIESSLNSGLGFYVKSGDLYYTGEFDRSVLPCPYLGSFYEALKFESLEDAEHWVERLGGEIIEGKDVPDIDFWKGEHHKAREQLREISKP